MSDATTSKVFVLGAGFTRAFAPRAPLVEDDYGLEALLDRFRGFETARRILELERASPTRLINIERLMTRLDGGMPYDSDTAKDELRLLLAGVRRQLAQRLGAARDEWSHDEMAALADYCVRNTITCITFNYDDLFDQSLWEVKKVIAGASGLYWHPDGGYGFFCRPSLTCVRDADTYMDLMEPLLLKLHGSVNWRPKRGARAPYTIDDLVHHEPWLQHPYPAGSSPTYEPIEAHLEPEAFIIPPVLMKSALFEQPVLRLVWSHARRALERATEVVFIGYSLPVTDLAARYLFSETLQGRDQVTIRIVNRAEQAHDREATTAAYRTLFPRLEDSNFEFEGARAWATRLVDAGRSER